MLRKAVDWGVTYWDTANIYSNGNAEIGMGKFIAKNPELRDKLFICTKASGAKNVKDLDRLLAISLERLQTDYIDVFYPIHGLGNSSNLVDEIKQWSESAKKKGLIRFVGFSTHSNMARCLEAAVESGWIDAVTTSYNFHLMQDEKLTAAIEKAHKAGIAVTAMKTQGHMVKKPARAEMELIKHFQNRGYEPGQAKIKLVLENPNITSACVGIGSLNLLRHNAEAVCKKDDLTAADLQAFRQYAQFCCNGYCAGCSEKCEKAADTDHLADTMRYLMYHDSYCDTDRARELFARIPAGERRRLAKADFAAAQAVCPRNLPIGQLVSEAFAKLS